MRKTRIGGMIPADVRASIADGDLDLTVDKTMDGKLLVLFDGKTPDEVVNTLNDNSIDKGNVIILRNHNQEGNDELLITSVEADRARKQKKVIDRIVNLTDAMVEQLPDFREYADKNIARLKEKSCPSCKISGVIRQLSKTFADMALSRGVELDMSAFTGKAYPADIAYLRTVLTKPESPQVKPKDVRDPSVAIPESAGGPRPSCADCFRKHIGKAAVLLEEADLGYPNHFWLAMGNLSEAEAESMTDWPGLASTVREVRIEMMENREYKPDLMQFFDMIDELTGNVENA